MPGTSIERHKPRPRRVTKLPITPELLRKMRQSWSTNPGGDPWNTTMVWAAATLCFFEITVPRESAFDQGAHLSFEDVTVDCARDSK
jgi:hypothetical protein